MPDLVSDLCLAGCILIQTLLMCWEAAPLLQILPARLRSWAHESSSQFEKDGSSLHMQILHKFDRT